jgi:CRP/FNR family transcriptional regulator
MSRSDIGSYLSLVIETVSRGLSKLQDEGVIAVKGRHLEVLEPERLASIAHGEEGDGERCAGRR